MKKSLILTIITIIIDIVLFVAGIITDILYWRWVYEHSDMPGHGAPAFSLLAVLIIILFSAIMAIIICIKIVKEKNKANIKTQ